MKDCLVGVEVWDVGRGRRATLSAGDLELGYRTSNLTDAQLVVEASLALQEADTAEVRARMESYRRHRADTQPGALQNAGSVFRNPPGDHAGRLVEAAGLKGFTVGGARVAELHANFFIAGEGATAQDVYELVGRVIDKVRAAHGVELVPEIRFVGAFQDRVREGTPR
jgi:UDP-N-acetylmuramate dehydrogenase